MAKPVKQMKKREEFAPIIVVKDGCLRVVSNITVWVTAKLVRVITHESQIDIDIVTGQVRSDRHADLVAKYKAKRDALKAA